MMRGVLIGLFVSIGLWGSTGPGHAGTTHIVVDGHARIPLGNVVDFPVGRTAEDVPAAQPSDQTKTWLFHMDHAREVAFAASRAFVWDAARINLPDGKTALAQSVYPVESAGDAAWGRSTEYLKFAIEDFSRRWFPYPWPNAVNVAGPVGGMEYPGVAFVSAASKGKTLFWITVHEIGHTYFPMVVGANERRYAWMDEGLNTFIDV
jgi:hypothetical protein